MAAAVRAVVDNPAYHPTTAIRFFQEYFGYTRVPDVFKDGRLHEHGKEEFKHDSAMMSAGDTNSFVVWVLQQDKDVLRELLTSNRMFVKTSWDWGKKAPKQEGIGSPQHKPELHPGLFAKEDRKNSLAGLEVRRSGSPATGRRPTRTCRYCTPPGSRGTRSGCRTRSWRTWTRRGRCRRSWPERGAGTWTRR